MRLAVQVEPAGKKAEAVMLSWCESFGLPIKNDSVVEVDPDHCLEVLADLRNRCYDQGLMVNVSFSDD